MYDRKISMVCQWLCVAIWNDDELLLFCNKEDPPTRFISLSADQALYIPTAVEFDVGRM